MAGRFLSLLAALAAVSADLDIANLAPEALDLTSTDAGLVGWLNSCTDGTHIYLCPRNSFGNPNLARVAAIAGQGASATPAPSLPPLQ